MLLLFGVFFFPGPPPETKDLEPSEEMLLSDYFGSDAVQNKETQPVVPKEMPEPIKQGAVTLVRGF